MSADIDEDENPLVKLTSLAVLGLGLTLLFLGVELFWLVFVIGFAVVVPIVATLTEEFDIGSTDDDRRRDSRTPDRARMPDDASTAEAGSKQDALDTLRERYARGDLSEAEFERKVENLLGTETPEDARRHVQQERGQADLETEEGRE